LIIPNIIEDVSRKRLTVELKISRFLDSELNISQV